MPWWPRACSANRPERPATLPERLKALANDQDEERHRFDPDLLKHFA